MEAYTFHEGALPSPVTLDYQPAIFNLPGFAALQGAPAGASFYLLDRRRGNACAGVHFHIEGTTARTPYRAPFGSFDLAEKINPGALYRFIGEVGRALRQQGVTEVVLRNPPREYNVAGYSMLETFLLNHEYVVCDAEISAVIPLRGEPFVGVIRNSERLRIRQSISAGLQFRMLPHDRAGSVYEFISQRHGEKGYRMSVSHGDFERTIRVFPDRYFLFGVFRGQEMCAAAVSVRVTGNVLWNFLVNHETVYNRLSPSVLLMQGIYGYCEEHGIALFDLGTSALRGQPNLSLLDFKLHLGAVPVSKLSFHKKLV